MVGIDGVFWLIGCAALAQPGATAGTNAVAPPFAESETNSGVADKGLTLNFRGVPVETVLSYLSKAAGLTIIREADTQGSAMSIW